MLPVLAMVFVVLVLAVMPVLMLLLVLLLIRKDEAGVREVAATDFFLGGKPPLRPLPIGIPVSTKLVMFGRFLAFTNQSINPFSSPSVSATATL